MPGSGTASGSHLWGPLNVDEPNIHVNMLGVPPRFQGRGLGRRLLERVHAMSREHPDSRGVSLTTESAGNVPFYERLGYRMVGHGRIGPGLESWGFFRPGLSPHRLRRSRPCCHIGRG